MNVEERFKSNSESFYISWECMCGHKQIMFQMGNKEIYQDIKTSSPDYKYCNKCREIKSGTIMAKGRSKAFVQFTSGDWFKLGK